MKLLARVRDCVAVSSTTLFLCANGVYASDPCVWDKYTSRHKTAKLGAALLLRLGGALQDLQTLLKCLWFCKTEKIPKMLLCKRPCSFLVCSAGHFYMQSWTFLTTCCNLGGVST